MRILVDDYYPFTYFRAGRILGKNNQIAVGERRGTGDARGKVLALRAPDRS